MRCLHCKWKFKVRYFLQKHCEINDECKEASFQYKLGKKTIPKVSDHRQEELDLYKILNRKFLKENLMCQKCGNKPSTEIHHKKGREGVLLNIVKYFMAVDGDCHKYIGLHPLEAIQNGWSISRTEI